MKLLREAMNLFKENGVHFGEAKCIVMIVEILVTQESFEAGGGRKFFTPV